MQEFQSEKAEELRFVRGVRPCIVALRLDPDDGNTYWDYLNIKYPGRPLCFSIFEADVKDAITISQGRGFLHFGYTSNRNGGISCHKFEKPKEITYVINFSNSAILQELAVSLPCRRTGSLSQNQLIGDKSIQRMIVSSDILLRLFVSKETHTTGGFKYDLLAQLNKANSVDKINVIDFNTINLCLKKFVSDYFEQHPTENKIVIKTMSWDSFNAGVLILDRSEVANLSKKLESLQITPDVNVIAECFVDNQLDAERAYHRIRVYSTRNGKEKGIHQSNIPTSISPLFYTFSRHGPYCTDETSMLYVDTVTSADIRRQIHVITQHYWNTMVPVLMKVDKGAEPVLFGFDFVLSQNGPACIKVKNLDSLSTLSMFVYETYGDECGLVPLYGMYNHMLTHSYDYMLGGRTILVVGVGSYCKLHLFEFLASIEAKVVLIDTQPPPSGIEVQYYIKASLYEPSQYEVEIKKVVSKLKELNVVPFSIVALYEDHIPFRIMLTNVLQQEGILNVCNHTLSVEDSLRNKDKVRVYKTLRGGTSSYFEACHYSIASDAIVLTDENVSTIQIDRPRILKLSTSSASYGCMRINSTKDIIPAYNAAKRLVVNTPLDGGFGMCFGTQIFMSELYKGSEHNLDIIMSDGEAVWHIFGDKSIVDAESKPMAIGSQFRNKGRVMPSRIITGLKSKQILSRIVQSLKCLSLIHGVFNVDFILTALGVKIIDVNQRPGGYYINEWVNAISGVCIFTAEVILQSELEYFVQPLVTNRSITGFNVFTKKELIEEMAQYTNSDEDIHVFFV